MSQIVDLKNVGQTFSSSFLETSKPYYKPSVLVCKNSYRYGVLICILASSQLSFNRYFEKCYTMLHKSDVASLTS